MYPCQRCPCQAEAIMRLQDLMESQHHETIKWTIRYSPSIDKKLWEMQESVKTEDWEKFKEEVYDLYPGSKGENRYSLATLQAFIDKQTSFTIQEAEDYGTYYHSFSKNFKLSQESIMPIRQRNWQIFITRPQTNIQNQSTGTTQSGGPKTSHRSLQQPYLFCL